MRINASYLQLVAADVVDDEDVERHGEEYDAGDADDLEGLGGDILVDNIIDQWQRRDAP